MEQTLTNLGLSALFALLGFVLLFVSYRLLDFLTPLDMSKKIFEDGNIAVAIFAAGFVIALAHIIASAIS
jgi:putative membrane protein